MSVENSLNSSALPSQPGLTDSKKRIHDVIGLGFGPSNLALVATLEEESLATHGRSLSCLFIERKSTFQWYPGMLLDGARIQLSFLKDLVTLRNPRSRFTFLNYLLEKGRLDRFANLRQFFPTRLEFNDYYSWVADQLKDRVRYGGEVVSVLPVKEDDGDGVEYLRVLVRDIEAGDLEEHLTRNLVVATGGVPWLPESVRQASGQRVLHSQDFLHCLPQQCPDKSEAHRFVVVGSGQSGAEIFEYLYENYPNADVTSAIRRFAYQPADESHFVNEIFFPDMEDFLYELPPEKRLKIIKSHRDTNYSAVDRELIESIYEALYQDEVAGIDRARVLPFLELQDLQDNGSEVTLEFRDLVREESKSLSADFVILATGYERPKRHPMLDNLSSYLLEDSDSGYQVDRSYRVRTREEFKPRLFLQGFCEDTYGLSDTLLSTLPIRSKQILESLLVEENVASFAEEGAASKVEELVAETQSAAVRG